jgi:two-component system sensor histidine kinase YesM
MTVFAVIFTASFSYFIARTQIEKNAYTQLNDTVNQTSVLLNDRFSLALQQLMAIKEDSYFEDMIQQLMLQPGQTDINYDDLIGIHNSLNEIYQQYPDVIDSIYLNVNGNEIEMIEGYYPRSSQFNFSEWPQTDSITGSNYCWLLPHVDKVFNTIEQREVFTVYTELSISDSSMNCVLLINLKKDYFLNLMSDLKVSANGYLVLTDGKSVMYSKAVPDKYRLGSSEIQKLPKGLPSNEENEVNGRISIKDASGVKMFMTYDKMRINGWLVVAVVPENDILSNTQKIQQLTLILVLTLVLVCSLFATLLADGISKSLRLLVSKVNSFENGESNIDFNIRGNREIEILSTCLSGLRRSINNLLERVKNEQELKRKMELKALQLQINPHFLYNTLSSIMCLVDMKKNERASKMIGALTSFLITGVSRGKEMISLKEELSHAESYLIIQQIRFSDMLQYEFYVDEDVLSSRIIKLTLQPIIENSIQHGFANKSGIGYIRITAKHVNNDIEIEIFDNGNGIDTGKVEKLKESIGNFDSEDTISFGLRNVNLRLILNFGKSSGLSIESEVNSYTIVRFKIPFENRLLENE